MGLPCGSTFWQIQPIKTRLGHAAAEVRKPRATSKE